MSARHGDGIGTTEILERLVSFPTVSSDSNLALIDHCRSWFEACGAATFIQPSADGRKANLLATLGPGVAGGVVLSGHTDVVPIEGEIWRSDPWRLSLRAGKLFGRGACDMKGFLALCMALAHDTEAAKLTRPLHFAFTYDEEVGCAGGRALVSELARRLPPPAAVIVGEPTRNQVANGHKSYTELITRFRGVPMHSARCDLGASAVLAAARTAAWLGDLQQELIAAAPDDSVFHPGFTSLHCGVIAGGTSPTAVAEQARLTTDIRCIPGDDPQRFIAALTEKAEEFAGFRIVAGAPRCTAEVEILTDIPGLSPEPGGYAERLMLEMSPVKTPRTVPFGTEAGLFQQQGWSTVVCGPGDITHAHQPDEFIELSELETGAEILRRLASTLI